MGSEADQSVIRTREMEQARWLNQERKDHATRVRERERDEARRRGNGEDEGSKGPRVQVRLARPWHRHEVEMNARGVEKRHTLDWTYILYMQTRRYFMRGCQT